MEPQEPTFSDEMAPSKPSTEVLELGRRIIRELKTVEHDVLSQWMSHYIAELLSLAEQSRSQEDKDKCADMILRLWDRRQYWPYKVPLHRVTELLSELTPIRVLYERKAYAENTNTWYEVYSRLMELHETELEVCRTVGLLAVEDQIAALIAEEEEEEGTSGDATNRNLVKRIRIIYQDLQALTELRKMDAEQRKAWVLSRFTEINAERLELLTSIKPDCLEVEDGISEDIEPCDFAG